MLASGLSIEIFDADSWSADDFLGGTHLPLKFLNTRDGKQSIEPLWPRPTKWREMGARFSDKGGFKDGVKVEVAHPKLARLFIGMEEAGAAYDHSSSVQSYSAGSCGQGIEHQTRTASTNKILPRDEAAGTLGCIRFKQTETSLNEACAARTPIRSSNEPLADRTRPRYSSFCSPTRLLTLPARSFSRMRASTYLSAPVCFY